MRKQLQNLIIAFTILFLGGTIVAGISGLYNAITGSGLLSGTITTTVVKYTPPDVKISQLEAQGYVNTTDQTVYFIPIDTNYDHRPDQILVKVYKTQRIPQYMTIEGKTVVRYINKTDLVEAKTVDLKEITTMETNYDFTPVLQVIVVFSLLGLFIGALYKLGIRI